MSAIESGEFLYETTVTFTKIVEYGLSLEALGSGEASLPAAGARFDYHFQGVLRGPRVSGTLAGIDYVRVRADDHTQEVHAHAQLVTEDGGSIAYFVDGVALPQQGTSEWLLRHTVSFITASPAYTWLNEVQGRGQGTIDSGRGEVAVKIYAA